MKKSLAILVALVVPLAAASSAQAGPFVTITVDGVGPTAFPGPVTPPANAPHGPDGYPGDTVELLGSSFEFELVAGTSIQTINTLLWTIDYTYAGTETDPDAWSDLVFVFNAVRDMTVDSTVESIGQTGTLEVTWDNDFLSLNDGATQTFVVQGYRIDMKPLGLAEVGGSNFSGGNPWTQPARDVTAEFTVTAVPDGGATLALLGAALLGLGALRRKLT